MHNDVYMVINVGCQNLMTYPSSQLYGYNGATEPFKLDPQRRSA